MTGVQTCALPIYLSALIEACSPFSTVGRWWFSRIYIIVSKDIINELFKQRNARALTNII